MLKPNTGRFVSAAGAGLLIASLLLVWYEIDRRTAGDTTSTGWETFPRLRIALLVGAVATIVTAMVRQTRPVLVAPTVLGVVLALLIARRIVDPPDIADPVQPDVGVYIALLAALAVGLGGLVDTSRRMIAGYGGLGGSGSPALPPAGDGGSPGGAAVVRVPNEAERARR
jgi:hypothetical protein